MFKQVACSLASGPCVTLSANHVHVIFYFSEACQGSSTMLSQSRLCCLFARENDRQLRGSYEAAGAITYMYSRQLMQGASRNEFLQELPQSKCALAERIVRVLGVMKRQQWLCRNPSRCQPWAVFANCLFSFLRTYPSQPLF